MNKIGLVLMGLFLLGAASLKAQTLVYQQDFKQQGPEWSDRDDMYSHEKMENGKFWITQKKEKYSYHGVEVVLEDERDYSVETAVTHVSGTEQSPYGLVFASSGETDYYVFAISANGTYTLGYRNQGHYKSFIAPTESKSIKKGNSTNKLRVEIVGDKLKLIINDHEVKVVNMISPYGNDVGFIVEKEQTVAFDYLTVKYLQDAGKEIAAVPAKPIVSPPADTAKHPVNQPAKEIALKNMISPPVSNVVSVPVRDTGKRAVNQQPKDSVKRPANSVAALLVKDTTKKPASTLASLPVKDTVKKPADIVSAAAAKDSVKQAAVATKHAAIKDTVKQVVKALPAQPVSASIVEMAYHTDFSTTDEMGWVLNRTDSVKTTISKGGLRISRTAKVLWFTDATRAENHVDMHRDFLIETRAIHYSGGKYYDYGLEFGGDTTRRYHFWIEPAGDYSICYTSGNGFIKRLRYGVSDFINKGDSVKNKLGIEHKNGQLYFFINDKQVEKLPEIDFTGEQFGFSVYSSQDAGFDYLTFGYLDHPAPLVKTDTVPGPKIYITSPKVTRGLKIVKADTLHVAGIAKDPKGIFSIRVNDIEASFNMNGDFIADIPLVSGDNTLKVVALNEDRNQSTYTFHIVKDVNSPPAEQVTEKLLGSQSKYYALLIGEEEYHDAHLRSLEGPIRDANKLKDALLNNYTFDKENVTVLQSPSREQLFNALIDIRNKATTEDNVLIFYAGHGYYDETTTQGYWLPSDAISDKSYTWISNSEIITSITAIKSKHTLLISDACFSGSILRTRGLDLASKAIKELYKLPSRNAMTSSTKKEEVSDDSPFLKYLVKFLTESTDPYLSSQQLFERFKNAVINNSDANTQIPQFGELRGTGDEGGDFIFIRKNN